MRKSVLIGVFGAGILGFVTACEVSKVDALTVPLVYKSTSRTLIAKGPSCTAISDIRVEDRRTDKVLGTRIHESKPLKADVSTSGDPAAWVREGLQSFLARNRVTTAADGPLLVVDLDGLKTQENIWHRSGYDAKISLKARLESHGKVCAEQAVEGKGGNYGYSGSIENYQEMLSNTLDDAAQHLLDSPLFDTAACQCAG